jgi:hypothetical protein
MEVRMRARQSLIKNASHLVIVSALALAGLVLTTAAAAWAHSAYLQVACSGVTFNYSYFPTADYNTVAETISVNGATVYSQDFVFNGSSATHTVTLNASGDVTVVASVTWNTNGVSGSTTTGAVSLSCPTEVATTTTTQPTTTTTTSLPTTSTTTPIMPGTSPGVPTASGGPSASVTPAQLAVTGPPSWLWWLARFGAVLIVTGALLIALTRSRRRFPAG